MNNCAYYVALPAICAMARHLAWMRDEIGKSFVAGLVLHTGPHAFPLGDQIVAVPRAFLGA